MIRELFELQKRVTMIEMTLANVIQKMKEMEFKK